MPDLENNFKYHAPTPEQVQMYTDLRDAGKAFAELVQKTCPSSREQAIAFTKIEEAVMWANASIARNQ